MAYSTTGTAFDVSAGIMVGLGLSGVAMVFAAYGLIAPVVGAVLQEVIDIAVIVNALRTSR